MTHSRRDRGARTGRLSRMAVAAAGLALLAGCTSAGGASDGTVDPEAVGTGWVGSAHDDTDDARDGGTLSYATYRSVSSLDPADRQDGGATGGTEMAAVYDVLMRYDADDDAYVPQLAEALTPNADKTEWTLTLRPDVTFSDGTPVDADAVVWSIDHYLDKRGTHAQIWEESVESTVAQDPSTVKYTLTRPWTDFPAMLTTGPGMIVAPSSMDGGSFTPVGAGPFTVQQFSPQDVLVLAARPDYWGGRPHLDELRFPAIVQEQGKVDAVKTGGVQLGYIRNVDVQHDAITGGLSGWSYAANMSNILLINSREGRAGSDTRVRQAIVAALDPEVFNTRVSGGYGSPSTAMFPESSTWSDGDTTTRFDPDKAQRLLAEAKADGYDGVLHYAGVNEPAAQSSALAFQAMLESVGFTVELDLSSNINDLVKKMYASYDYDVGLAAFNVLDEAPFVRLFGNLDSGSSSNALGFRNERMDQLLLEVQSAADENGKRAALQQMQKLVDETAPFATLGAGRAFIAMNDSVHGVVPNMDGIMLFDQAWTEPA